MLVSPPLPLDSSTQQVIPREREKREKAISAKKADYDKKCGDLYKQYMGCLHVRSIPFSFPPSRSQRNPFISAPFEFPTLISRTRYRNRSEKRKDSRRCSSSRELRNRSLAGVASRSLRRMISRGSSISRIDVEVSARSCKRALRISGDGLGGRKRECGWVPKESII